MLCGGIINTIESISFDCFPGAVFDVNVNENKQVIEYAIDRANKIILGESEFQLSAEIVEVPYGNEYATSKAVCELLEVKNPKHLLRAHMTSPCCLFFRKVCQRFLAPMRSRHPSMVPIFAIRKKCRTSTRAGIPSRECRSSICIPVHRRWHRCWSIW